MKNKKKYYIYVWGCAANLADSQRIAGFYEKKNWVKAKNCEEADEIVFVTCSVRKSAEDRVLGLIHNLSQKYKKSCHSEVRPNNPNRILLPPRRDQDDKVKMKKPTLILTGCMLHYGAEKLKKKLPLIDKFIPISEFPFSLPSVRKDKKHALVPISSGCNSFCTYCIVPLARGREISRQQKEIIEEIKCLVKKGYSQFTLLGQNVNSYGLEKVGINLRKVLDTSKKIPSNQSQYRSFRGKPPFVKLLEKVCQIPQVKKVSFMSSNPWDFYEELIDCIAQNPKIDRQLHLPLQSGDDEILAKMNRGYTAKQYFELVKKIREIISDAVLTTDIIVGFPGEGKKQFENTVKLCRKIGFKLAYISRYSPRPNTVSSKLFPDNISDQEKKHRWQILENLINKPNL